MSDALRTDTAGLPAAAEPATGAIDLWRIPGEATPGWVIGLAGLVGAALAVVAIDPWLSVEPAAVDEPAAVVPGPMATVSPSAPAAVVAPAAPIAGGAMVSGEAPHREAPEPVAAPSVAVPAPEPAVTPAVPAAVVVPAPVAEVSAPPAAVAAASVAPPPVLGATATALAAVPPVAAVPPCLPVVGIAFARGSSRLESGPWEAASEPLRRWVAEHPGTTLSVEGHADTSGTEDFNLVLSFARARAAVAGLARLGVGEDRMIARAAGTDQPRNGPAGITTNRLVVLRVDGVDVCRDVERTRQP